MSNNTSTSARRSGFDKAQHHKEREMISPGNQGVRPASKGSFWRGNIQQALQLKARSEAGVQVLLQRPLIKVDFDPLFRHTPVGERLTGIKVIGNMAANDKGVGAVHGEDQAAPRLDD